MTCCFLCMFLTDQNSQGKEAGMERKQAFTALFLWCLLFLCIVGCAGNAEITQTEERETSAEGLVKEKKEETKGDAEEEPEADASAKVKQGRREIPIAFPFYGDEEGHRLTLAAPETGENAYTLLHYDGDGKILEQIFCGNLTEPVTFSFDGLAYGSWLDLEIFPADRETGLLFLWEKGHFSTTPIGIPRYVECRDTAMLTEAEDEKVCEKEVYILNEDRLRSEKARSYKLQKDTAMLTIWDELEKRYIFEGKIRLDESGNPVNQKYFDGLLWGGVPLLFGYEAESTIRTWVGKNPKSQGEGEAVEIDNYGDMRYVLDNPGNIEEYESREALLTEFGLENSAPMYQYFDQEGDLGLELYADEDREQICGFVYTNATNSDLEKVTRIQGFTICSIPEVKWNGGDPYRFVSVYGTTGEEKENVKDYKESVTYTPSGKPDRFVATGRVEGWSAEDMIQDILRIEFIYREDDTLYYRYYYHSHQAFGTTLQGMNSYYDEHERVIYESGYVTHGGLEYYYIYEDTDGKTADKPAYILQVDYTMGDAISSMIRCL